jgi:hypothetical protein
VKTSGGFRVYAYDDSKTWDPIRMDAEKYRALSRHTRERGKCQPAKYKRRARPNNKGIRHEAITTMPCDLKRATALVLNQDNGSV